MSIAFDMSSAMAVVLSSDFLIEPCRDCCIYCLHSCYKGVFRFESVLVSVAL